MSKIFSIWYWHQKMPDDFERDESDGQNQSFTNTIPAVKNKKSCCTLKRTFICCFILFANCVICCLIVLIIMGVLFSGLSSIRKYLSRIFSNLKKLEKKNFESVKSLFYGNPFLWVRSFGYKDRRTSKSHNF